MTELERAVVDAAKAWAKEHAWDVRSLPQDVKLFQAVKELERAHVPCPATGILGDLAWPFTVTCELTKDHAGYHQDPARNVQWRGPRG